MEVFAPFATFAVFVVVAKYTGKQLDTSAAFTALSLVSLLASPMNTLIRSIPELNSANACFKRIQDFLNSDARKDHRIPLGGSIDFVVSPGSDVELCSLSPTTQSRSQNPILYTQNASFGWDSRSGPTVSDVTFSLMRHQFCFIIGPVGSGKSTLLKGLLGETPSTKGFVYSNSTSTAYVDQTPWIQNGTIQQNILGVSSFEEPWYSQVVRACALDVDISKLPRGHGNISLPKFFHY